MIAVGGVGAVGAVGAVGGMGCKPHGQRWEGWGASRTGRVSCKGGSGENKKSEPFWGLTLYSNNEKRLNFFYGN